MPDDGYFRPVKLSDFAVGCFMLAVVFAGIGFAGKTEIKWLGYIGIAVAFAGLVILWVSMRRA